MSRAALVLALCLAACRSADVDRTFARDVDRTFALGVDAELQARSLHGEARHRMQERALAAYDEVLASAPRDTATLSNRANIKADRGDLHGALLDLDAALVHASGPERAFYLRRSGDVLAQAGRTAQSTTRYLQALQWHPREHLAHLRVVERLRSSPPLQITNYLRFLLETNQTERVIAAGATLPDSPDVTAAAALALAHSARIVPAERLERVAAPLLDRGSNAGRELRAVLRADLESSFPWLEQQSGVAATTDAPPHAAFRGLARVLGTTAAVRGELVFAERAFRLATMMPGADATDLAALFEFHAQYQTLPELRAFIEKEAPRAPREIVFHRTAIGGYALFEREACGDDAWGIRHHALRLVALGADLPPVARELCPAEVSSIADRKQSCPVTLDMSGDGEHHGVLLAYPADTEACAIDRALDFLVLDYRHAKLRPLAVEALPRHRSVAEDARAKLIARGVGADRVRVVEARHGGDRIRIRLD